MAATLKIQRFESADKRQRPAGLFRLRSVADAFQASDEPGEAHGSRSPADMRMSRWAATLTELQVQRWGKELWIVGDAVLPNGFTVAAWQTESKLRKNQSELEARATDAERAAQQRKTAFAQAVQAFVTAQWGENPQLAKGEIFRRFRDSAEGRKWQAEGVGISRTRIYAVMADLRSEDRGLRTRGRPRGGAIHPELREAFMQWWGSGNRPTARGAFERVARYADDRGIDCPSYATFLRFVQSMRTEAPGVVALMRDGKARANAQYAPRIMRNYRRYQPIEYWAGDHHELDVIARYVEAGEEKVGRPWITVWMDMGSCALVGWRITMNPSSDTIIGAFADAAKLHGLPKRILMDNGRDYRCKSFAGGRKSEKISDRFTPNLLEQLHIEASWALVYSPESKGRTERFFRSLCERFSKWLPGYVGSSPATRPEGVHADARNGKLPLLSIEDLAVLFARWVETDYHARPHSGQGMDGRSPAQVLRDNPIARRTAPSTPVCFAPSGEAITHLDLLLMRPVAAKVGKQGVRCNTFVYGNMDPAITGHVGREIMLRVPEDAGYVVACERDGRILGVLRNHTLLMEGATQEDVRAGMREQRRVQRDRKRAAAALYGIPKTGLDHVVIATRKNRKQSRAKTGTHDAPVERDVTIVAQALRTAPASHAQHPARRVMDIVELMGTLARSASDERAEVRNHTDFAAAYNKIRDAEINRPRTGGDNSDLYADCDLDDVRPRPVGDNSIWEDDDGEPTSGGAA